MASVASAASTTVRGPQTRPRVRTSEVQCQTEFTWPDSEQFPVRLQSADITPQSSRSTNTVQTIPDDIHYQMLKHLPESALSTRLHIINKHWCSESFHSIWHHAVVLRIPKADKDKTDPCSYPSSSKAFFKTDSFK